MAQAKKTIVKKTAKKKTEKSEPTSIEDAEGLRSIMNKALDILIKADLRGVIVVTGNTAKPDTHIMAAAGFNTDGKNIFETIGKTYAALNDIAQNATERAERASSAEAVAAFLANNTVPHKERP